MDICETYSDRKLFCNDWEFYKAAFGSDYSEDFAFKPVDIPHDWLIYNTNDLYETSTGWYRKNFSYQKKEGIRTFIRFDGVYMDSKVYVNGTLAGSGNTAIRHLCSISPTLLRTERTLLLSVWITTRQTQGGIREQAFSERFGFAKALRYASAMTAFTSQRQRTRTAGR